MDEAKYKRNEAENEKLLKEFEQYLRNKDLSDKTINNRIRNIKLVKNSLNCISQEFPVKKMALKGLIMRNSVQWFCFLLKKPLNY